MKLLRPPYFHISNLLLTLHSLLVIVFHSSGELFCLQNPVPMYPPSYANLLCDRLLFICHHTLYIPLCRPAALGFAALGDHLPHMGWVGTGVFQVQPSELAHRVAWGARCGCHGDPRGDLCMAIGPIVTARSTSITVTSANTAASRSASGWA